jgi:23S rRNA (guanine745-N1)-methyltransferase
MDAPPEAAAVCRTARTTSDTTVSLRCLMYHKRPLWSHCARLGEFRQVVLICPICRAPTHRVDRSLVCPRGHSFDLAREGYVNFLRSNHPGDTREMLASRRRFLDRGHYAPIGRRVCELAASHLAGSPSRDDSRRHSVVDAGCGEGYYLGLMQTHLRASGEIDVHCVGVDSSRDACRMAAQRYKHLCFVVSDLKDLIPVADGSVDILLDIFAPRSVAEFSRVLATFGLIIVVIPQPNHLEELQSSFPLIGIESNKADHVMRRFEPTLRLIDRESFAYELSLQRAEVVDLVGMSPSHRHLTEPLLPPSGPFGVTVAVEILAFRRGTEASDSEEGVYHAGYTRPEGSKA